MTFRTSTIGRMANHENISKGIMIRVEVYEDKVGVKLVAVSGLNLSPIRCIPNVFVSFDEYEDAPEDPYDDCVFQRWAFDKAGLM